MFCTYYYACNGREDTRLIRFDNYVFFLIQKVQLCGALSTHDIDPLRVDTKQRDH